MSSWGHLKGPVGVVAYWNIMVEQLLNIHQCFICEEFQINCDSKTQCTGKTILLSKTVVMIIDAKYI